jgi:sulfonate transport system permease protein
MGFLIKRGMDTHQPALVLGGMILIALMAWISSFAITLIERRLCPWKAGIDNL